MNDTPEISVEKAIAIIAKHCEGTECDSCPYSVSLPKWGFYLCMFQSIQPPRNWPSCESADE